MLSITFYILKNKLFEILKIMVILKYGIDHSLWILAPVEFGQISCVVRFYFSGNSKTCSFCGRIISYLMGEWLVTNGIWVFVSPARLALI